MITDKENELSAAQAITVTAQSTNTIDGGAASDLGQLDDVQLCITVKETFAAVGAATLQVQLQTDSDPGMASGALKAVLETPAIAKATLVAGYQFFLPVPLGLDLRYVCANYIVATGPFTAGKVDANFVLGVQRSKAYPDALTP